MNALRGASDVAVGVDPLPVLRVLSQTVAVAVLCGLEAAIGHLWQALPHSVWKPGDWKTSAAGVADQKTS